MQNLELSYAFELHAAVLPRPVMKSLLRSAKLPDDIADRHAQLSLLVEGYNLSSRKCLRYMVKPSPKGIVDRKLAPESV